MLVTCMYVRRLSVYLSVCALGHCITLTPRVLVSTPVPGEWVALTGSGLGLDPSAVAVKSQLAVGITGSSTGNWPCISYCLFVSLH